MADITQTLLASAFDSTNRTEYTTASISPTANALIIMTVSGFNGTAATAPTITISGASMTWVEIKTQVYAGSDRNRMSVFRAMKASPGSGVLTITHSFEASSCSWIISEFANVDTGGSDGADAVVQFAQTLEEPGGSITVTLAAFSNVNNATHGSFARSAGSGFTPGSGFAEIADFAGNGQGAVMTEWRNDNDTTVDTLSSSADTLGIAIEIKNATQTVHPTALTSGSENTDNTVFTTASISPSANQLILLSVTGHTTSGAAIVPTIAGNGLTWVKIIDQQWRPIASPICSLTVFRAMGASPSSGTVVITFSGTQKDCAWVIAEFANIDTGGSDGADAIVQSAKEAHDLGGPTALEVTMSAFGNSANASFGVAGEVEGNSFTEGSGFSKVGTATGFATCDTEFKIENDTLIDWLISGTSAAGAIGIEIKNAVQVGARAAGTSGHLGMMLGW